jgi:hypothetical protein
MRQRRTPGFHWSMIISTGIWQPPDAARALLLVGDQCEPPMPASPIDRQLRRDTVPGVGDPTETLSLLLDLNARRLVVLVAFRLRVGNRLARAARDEAHLEAMLDVSLFADADPERALVFADCPSILSE